MMYFYADFFTVSSLIPVVFHLFISYLFLSIPNRSRSTYHLGLAHIFLAIVSADFLIAATWYHPWAAYTRWLNVFSIFYAFSHMNMFIYYFRNDEEPASVKTFKFIQYIIGIIMGVVFIYKTHDSIKIYQFAGHFWDLESDAASRIIAIAMLLYILTFFIIAIYKAITKKNIRKEVIMLAGSFLVASILPEIAYISTRQGAIDRQTYQITYNVFTVLGFFFMTILYMNYTKDRTSFMAKIIGISMVTFLVVLQGLGLYFFIDSEKAYDTERFLSARLSIQTGEYPDDLRYLISYDISNGNIKHLYQVSKKSANMDFTLNEDAYKNALIWKKISRLGKTGFKDNLEKLLSQSNIYYSGYKNAVLKLADDIPPSEEHPGAKLLSYVGKLNSTTFHRYNNIKEIPEENFRKGLTDFLNIEDKNFKPFRDAIREHINSSPSQNGDLKKEVLKYLLPLITEGMRGYRESNNVHYIYYLNADAAKNTVYESGFSYIVYRKYLHPAAMKYIYMICAVMFIVLVGFRFFFQNILVSPLQSLLKGLGAVKDGNLNIQLHYEVEDEIGYLTHSFNRMVNTINKANEERTKAEEALRAAEAKFRGLVEQSLAGIYIIQDGKYAYVNPKYAEIFGYSQEEMLTQDLVYSTISEEDQKVVAENIRQREVGEISSIRYGFQGVRKDGSKIYVEVHGTSMELNGRPAVIGTLIDITDRKKFQDELKFQKIFAENQLQNLAVAVFVIDSQHKVMLWNKACEVLTNVSAEKIIGTNDQWKAFYDLERSTLADVVMESQFDQMPSLYESYSKSAFIPNGWHAEGWYKNIGGHDRYMIFDAVPICMEEDKIIAVIETIQDITALKQTEEALRKSEETYRDVFENTGTATIIIEEDTTISLANSEFEKMSLFKKEEVQGKMSWIDLVSPKDIEKMKIYHEKRREDPDSVPRNYYFTFVRRDGSERETYLSVAMISGTKKSIAAITDITEMRRVEEEMVRMRHYLQNVIDSMPSMLVGIDAGGKITQWNMQASKNTGINQVDAMGMQIEKLLPQYDKQLVMIQKSIETREPQMLERMPVKIGDKTALQDIIVYPLIANKVEGAVLRIDDVTARVRIEEMMVQTEKMVSVGGLAAGMAHEINNPLGAILMGAENILRRISPELSGNKESADKFGIDLNKMQEYLVERKIISTIEGIREMGKRAAKIVTNMLNFSRKSEPRMVPTDLSLLLEKTIGIAAHDYDLRKKYDFRHIDIIREFDSNLPTVPCVATEIEQVVLNLLRNAAQAITEKQFINDAPKIILRLKTNGDMICIEIEDNGPGIEEENRKRIFEPFYTTKGFGLGTGLGLSVSYFIITNNHKGTINVESTHGRGSKFIINLPIVRNFWERNT